MEECKDCTIAMRDCIAEHREYYGELFSEGNSEEDDNLPFDASSLEKQEVEEEEEEDNIEEENVEEEGVEEEK